MSGRDEKAQRYIGLLDEARSNASWNEVPELIRKVTKHAPQRKCLVKTATLENEIVVYRSGAGQRPATARSAPPSVSQIESLEKDLRAEAPENVEDEVQQRACLLWARWAASEGVKEPRDDELYSTLPPGVSQTISTWSKVCVVKAAFIRGTLLARDERRRDAEAAYQAAFPFIGANTAALASNAQLAYWSEQLLAAIAVAQSHEDAEAPHHTLNEMALVAFRHWALLSTKSREVSTSAYGHAGPHRSRISVWRSYYLYLSDHLRTNFDDENSTTSRSDQVAELRRVENAYENELLRNTQFPKATESNQVIEEWVEQVISNWQIKCGQEWSEKDLGEGGRNSAGRNVIDILYRAAMKTFHSTLILRRLFQVHKSLADFDLAYRALDTYIELIERGRERTKKSKLPAAGQDDEELVLQTIAEGIEGLCSFGRQAEAEKAYDLCLKLELLLEEIDPSTLPQPVEGSQLNGYHENDGIFPMSLSPDTKDLVLRALGIGKAHWATWTPFNERRSALQAEAVSHLTMAANLSLNSFQKLRSSYALSLLLAETREIDASIEHLKNALVQDSNSDDHTIERQLIPIWHLLSLLLTARQEFDTAGQSCIAAFEQFPAPETLFGSLSARAASKSMEKSTSGGLIDDMECNELQRIIEIRMTELSLTDLMNGPEHAVNSSNDLLALYFRLFGHLDVAAEENKAPKALEPPKSSAGTVKSFRGSIFGRKKITSASEVFKSETNGAPPSLRSNPSRPATQATQAPTIQVTDSDEKPSPHKHRIFRPSSERSRASKRHSSQSQRGETLSMTHARPSSRERRPPPSLSDISTQRQSFETSAENPPSSTGTAETAQPHLSTIVSADEFPPPRPNTSTSPATTNDHVASTSAGGAQPLPPISHNLDFHQNVPPPTQHPDQPPKQDTRLPHISETSNTQPITRFPRATAKKHALTILVKIWLMIASLYRRAALFDDSREATDEAAKAALRIEAIVASIESSARAFADAGWGGSGKSSDEVWADVYCERAELLLAIARLKQEKGLVNESTIDVPRRAALRNDVTAEVDNEGVREAVEMYENCLMYFPNHAGGIVGLSNVLLDYYEKKVELGRKVDDGRPKDKTLLLVRHQVRLRGEPKQDGHAAIHSSESGVMNADGDGATATQANGSVLMEEDLKKTPENLNRLAARDRAYGLLSTLTKLGHGWDDSEAWFALARAHELGGEVKKAKEILWWVVRLEDTRPIRRWRDVGGGYVL